MKKLIVPILLAFLLWFAMFSPVTSGLLNFWLTMSVSATILVAVSCYMDKKSMLQSIHFSWQDVRIGVCSAALLWGIFWLGNYISTHIFSFAASQVSGVYAMKEGTNPKLIAILLLLLIGPAEEIFWHGFVQRNLSQSHGFLFTVSVTTLIYSLVHLPSLNFMLIMAALVCGLFWSILYYFNKNLLTVIVSHALWDCFVFVLFPIPAVS